MSEVITYVYEKELLQYQELAAQGVDLAKLDEWPEILWKVYSQPSGLAVIEVLQASRSDQELAALVIPTQNRVEEDSVNAIMRRFPGDIETTRAMVRLFVWAVRGLAISTVLTPNVAETERAVRLFGKLVQGFMESRLRVKE